VCVKKLLGEPPLVSEVSIFKTFLSLKKVLGIKLAIFPFTSGHNFFFGGREGATGLAQALEGAGSCGLQD